MPLKSSNNKHIESSVKSRSSSNSIYSVVSSSEVTAGSLHVWVDLPDQIKNDPSLAPFKQLYEQKHGKLPQQNLAESESILKQQQPAFGDETLYSENNSLQNVHSGKRLTQPQNGEFNNKLKTTLKNWWLQALRVTKLTALVGCWIALTAALLFNTEKTDVVLHTAVSRGLVKDYSLEGHKLNFRIQLTLTGPFAEATTSSSFLYVWLTGSGSDNSSYFDQDSTVWSIALQDANGMDFAPSSTARNVLALKRDLPSNGFKSNVTKEVRLTVTDAVKWNVKTISDSTVYLRMGTDSVKTVPLTVSYQLDPLSEEEGVICAALLLLLLYILIIFEIVNRTIAAMLTSCLSVGTLAMAGARPSLGELVSWLDTETLLLLFSMMTLVAILAETGLFDYLAVIAYELTGGRTWPLINCLCFFTAIFSTFLDNVTTVLLMTPVTIRLCEVMQLNPVPVLMSMVVFSNVGGAATPVGDPPNVIIASHPSLLRQNINFMTFTIHMGAGILFVALQTYLQLRYMFRDVNKLRHNVPRDILELRQEISVWKRAAASLSSYSRDEDIVRKALEKKVKKITSLLVRREANVKNSKGDQQFHCNLAQMKQKYRIRDKELLVKAAVCVSFVVIVFFLHALPQLENLSLGWTALLGALLLLLLAEKDDLEPVLARVEWSTLLFFAALFILMEALSKLGLISWVGHITESIILKVEEESRLATAIMLILWVSGVMSAFVDNIPLTTMMVRVTAGLAGANGLQLPLAPLAWALSFGACLGGNGTLIGASANVVCAGVAEQHGYRFTFLQYLKIGFPIMIGNLVVASGYLLLCHCVFHWH